MNEVSLEGILLLSAVAGVCLVKSVLLISEVFKFLIESDRFLHLGGRL